jgi:hypothetical protein
MGKSYLRFRPGGTHGLIASPACNVAVDRHGQIALTGQSECVGVWNIRRGVQVRHTPRGVRRQGSIARSALTIHALFAAD